MIICIKCGLEKDISEFYKHKLTKDGVLHKCKQCILEYQKNRDNSGIDRKREKTDKRKEWKKKFLKKFRAENPEKYKAQSMVGRFIRSNRQYKQTRCFVTGEENKIIHFHHFDYTKPNHVIPCTPSIHSKFHRGIITDIKEEWILILPF